MTKKKSFVFKGIDLKRELAAMAKLPVMKLYLKCSLPKLELRRKRRYTTGCSGYAYYRKGVISLCLSEGTTRASVLEVLLHELVHFAAKGEHHNDVFIGRLNRAAFEHWGIRVERLSDVNSKQKELGGYYGRKAYVVDRMLRDQLAAKLFRQDSLQQLLRFKQL